MLGCHIRIHQLDILTGSADYLAPFILIYSILNETGTGWIVLWEARKSGLFCSHSYKFAIGFSFWVLVQLLRIQFGAKLQ